MRRKACSTAGLLLALGLGSASGGEATPGAAFQYPQYDEVVAWVPAGKAATAAIAQGVVHIELYRARRHAADTLCDNGAPPHGRLVHRDGPYPVQLPAKTGKAWLYRLARVSSDRICNTTNATFLRTLSSFLPEWIVVRGANRKVAWRQGKAVTAGTTARLMVRR